VVARELSEIDEDRPLFIFDLTAIEKTHLSPPPYHFFLQKFVLYHK